MTVTAQPFVPVSCSLRYQATTLITLQEQPNFANLSELPYVLGGDKLVPVQKHLNRVTYFPEN